MSFPIRALSGAVVAAVLAAGAVVPAAGAASPPPSGGSPSTPASSSSSGTHTVTLITGDVVTVREAGGRSVASVVDAAGLTSNAKIIESGDDLYVYPQSAVPLVAAKTLDKRLFNVSQLIEDGYDDAHSPELPLIISYSTTSARLRGNALPDAARSVRTLSSVNASALGEKRSESADFWNDLTTAGSSLRGKASTFSAGIKQVWLDGKVSATLDESTAQIGAQKVWKDGNTGQGVTIAVIDTGIDAEHPDFAGRIDDTASFVPDETVVDRNGHGTHVASTIAGTGAASDGLERGVAPGATLDIAKVLSDSGQGQDSWVIAGMEWAARDKHAKIISMSLGSGPTDGSDPTSQAVESLSDETGALFVIAAGNAGAPNTVSAPSVAPSALSVGAVDANDQLAPFSSQGPRVGDSGIKPEITAPGVDILAARSQYAAEGEGSYQTLSGTSMATPHVAGAAALLLEAHPELTGPQLKDDLVSTSHATPDYTAFQAGNGRVDAAAAVNATLIAQGTASVSRVVKGGVTAVTQPVVYTNLGDEPITLDLTVNAPNVPAGLFSITGETLEVPAHGSAETTLTTERSLASESASFSGEIVATQSASKKTSKSDSTTARRGAAQVVRTAIAIGAVTHALTFTVIDAAGNPGGGVIEFFGDDTGGLGFVPVTGSETVYVPKGVYSAMMFTEVTGIHGAASRGLAVLGNPQISVSGDTEVVFDVRKVRRISTTIPQASVDTFARLDYFREMNGYIARSFLDATTYYDSMWTVPISGKVTHGEFDVTARWRKEQAVLAVASTTHAYTDLAIQGGGTPLRSGAATLGLVNAGDGAPADYAGKNVVGKAVVVRRNELVSDRDQAAAAIAAGAKLLLVANDGDGVPVRSYTGFPPEPLAIQIALVSKNEGDLLIADAVRKRPTVTATSKPSTDYVYDVVQTFHNAIPTKLTKTESKSTLARVNEDFSSASALQGGEFRFDFPTYNNWGIGYLSSRPLKSTRTDWVSASPLTLWGQESYGSVFEIAPLVTYKAKSTQTERWYKPINRPFLNNAYQAPYRAENSMRIDVPGFGGATHVGMAQADGMDQTVTLFQGEKEIATATGAFVSPTELPAETLPYRFEVKTSQTATASKLSRSTTTDWTFTSGAASTSEKVVLPMPQLSYGITANSAGVVKNGSKISIAAKQLPATVGGGKLGTPKLQLSYNDGKTWKTVKLTHRSNGSYWAKIAAHTGVHYVSTRTSVKDSKGNTVSQTIIRAFGVKK